MDSSAIRALVDKHFSEIAALVAKGQLLRQQEKSKEAAAACLEQAGKLALMGGNLSKALSFWQLAVDVVGSESLRQWVGLIERHAKSLPKEMLNALWLRLAETYSDSCNDGHVLAYLGNKLHKLKYYQQALPLYKKAYDLGRESLELCNMIALSLSHLEKHHEAIVWFRKGEGVPYNEEIAYWKARTIFFNGQGSQREANQLWDRWGREQLAGASPRPPMPPKPRPLRLGFCSYYFGAEIYHDRFVAQLAPTFVRRGVEMRPYIVFTKDPKSLPELPGCEWIHLANMDDPEQAKRIREDRLHALIDLDMILVTRNVELYRYSPAPLVMSAIHVSSSHGGAVDYLIMDDCYCPPGAEAGFAERVIRAKEPTYFPPPDLCAPPVVPPPCLTQGFITFGSFHQAYKLNEATLPIWAQMVKQVPNARLLLHSNTFDDYETDRVSKTLQRHGLAPERFKIVGYLSKSDYFASYSAVDIALDPLYCNGGLISIDALWQGVPVFTCPGSPDRLVTSRVGAALLTAIGRPEWIARDLDHWQRMVVEAASDYERLRQWRFELRPQMSQSIVCNGERLANVFLEAITPVIDAYYESKDNGH